MESSLEHVQVPLARHPMIAAPLPHQQAALDAADELYARSELSTRAERIERSIRKARRAS